jgi:hypothetical protein
MTVQWYRYRIFKSTGTVSNFYELLPAPGTTYIFKSLARIKYNFLMNGGCIPGTGTVYLYFFLPLLTKQKTKEQNYSLPRCRLLANVW